METTSFDPYAWKQTVTPQRLLPSLRGFPPTPTPHHYVANITATLITIHLLPHGLTSPTQKGRGHNSFWHLCVLWLPCGLAIVADDEDAATLVGLGLVLQPNLFASLDRGDSDPADNRTTATRCWRSVVDELIVDEAEY